MVARTRSGAPTQRARQSAKAKGHTLPGTTKFPINNKQDLKNAKRSIGRTTEPKEKVRAYINRRAKQLGAPPIGGRKGLMHNA